MAYLTSPERIILPLRSPHLVGRDPACLLCVDDPSVSAQHASLRWTGDRWVVRDLLSRNGTFVAGQRIARGDSAPLPAGGTVQFASGPEYTLAQDGPPVPFALADDGGVLLGRADHLDLGDDAVVYLSREGTWTLEHREQVWLVEDGHRHGQHVLRLPVQLAPTADATPKPSLEELILHFRVRRDEERVEITVELPGGVRHDLGGRSHHYTVLTLARIRRDDPPGWLATEELARRLRIEANLLYTHIHRARKQVLGLDVVGAAEIVERRGEQIRLGTNRFTEVRF